MDLNIIWFVLIAVLYTGYFVLEGFDFGVGILLPFLGKDDTQRRVIINTIGPHWDGNEVWLITAGGATFAAFPHWYATLFSGFYLPLFLMLIALIVRGVAFEFRSKDNHPVWRSFWDWAICIGSLIPSLFWGVAFVNIIKGVPINSSMDYIGGFWNLLNPLALLGGAVTLSGFILHGAVFLTLKTSGQLSESGRLIALRMWLPVLILLGSLSAATFYSTDLFTKPISIVFAVASLLILLLTGWTLRKKNDAWTFGLTTATIICTVVTVFSGLYPRVLVAADPALSLTIYNSASSSYTLQIMTYVALTLIPVILVYQGFSYWIFRKRIMEKPKNLEY